MSWKSLIGAALLSIGLTLCWAQEASKPVPQPSSQSQPSAAPAPQNPHNFQVSDEDAARKNPLRFTDVSVARGKQVFASQCAMCHGDSGDGTGDLAMDMGVKPPDFTKPQALKDRTDGALFTIIGTGNSTMPGQAKRMSDYYRWCLVNYLRSLGKRTPVKATQEEIDADQHKVIIPQSETAPHA
jgi:mono/diheme cytochrome c family protein